MNKDVDKELLRLEREIGELRAINVDERHDFEKRSLEWKSEALEKIKESLQIFQAEYDRTMNETVSIYRKYSGYLSILCVFRGGYGQGNYWTVTTKNSADYENGVKIKDAERLWRPHVTNEFAELCVKGRLCIWAETMTFKDQEHGARVLKEGLVVTAVGESEPWGPTDFLKFYKMPELWEFCEKNKLPHDSPIEVKRTEMWSFFKDLLAGKDFMTESRFSWLLTKHGILQMTSLHADVLGDVLEGLIVHDNTENFGRKNYIKASDLTPVMNITKHKFPNYVCRTLALRRLINPR